MEESIKSKIDGFMELVEKRNSHEPEFLQAVREVAETVIPYIIQHEIYNGKNILLRMVEPERCQERASGSRTGGAACLADGLYRHHREGIAQLRQGR